MELLQKKMNLSLMPCILHTMQIKEQLTVKNNREPTVEEIAKIMEVPKRQLYVLGEVGRHYFEERGIEINKQFHYTIQNPTYEPPTEYQPETEAPVQTEPQTEYQPETEPQQSSDISVTESSQTSDDTQPTQSYESGGDEPYVEEN